VEGVAWAHLHGGAAYPRHRGVLSRGIGGMGACGFPERVRRLMVLEWRGGGARILP